MSEHEKDIRFLRQCILYDESAERHKLEESITQLQRKERCVRRAVALMALLVGLALAGVCYSAVCLADYPQNMTQFMMLFVSKVFCALGLGSLMCLLAFAGLGAIYRKELDQRLEECRRVARNLLEAHRGKPPITPAPALAARETDVLQLVAQGNDRADKGHLSKDSNKKL
jgi:hypothetical protein